MKTWHLFWTLAALWGAWAQAQDLSDPRTTIDSDTLEMQGTDANNFFYFGGNVHVEGVDLDIRCDQLTVRTAREAKENEAMGQIGAVEEIVAVGHVVILQAGREARAGRVEVDPVGGLIRFLEDPVIIQGDVEAKAHGFIFHTVDKRLETINPPGFQPGQKEGRSSISISGLPVVTPNLPVEGVTIGDRATEAGTNEAGADADSGTSTEGTGE